MKSSKYETIVAFSAIFISFCAFAVSFYQTEVLKDQTRLMQEQQHASVWPRLLVSRNTGPGISDIQIRNDGVGPAQVKHVEVTVDGIIKKRWTEVLSALTNFKGFSASRSTITNRVIRQGDNFILLNIQNEELADSINANSHRIAISIYYSSIYGRNWLLKEEFGQKGFSIPEQVEATKFDKENNFLD